MDNLTPDINEQNISFIQEQIRRKQSSMPYFATNNTVTNIITDYDHHPYTRWYRGVYYYPDAIVAEREAGFRKLENSCYNLVIPQKPEKNPPHCFETPCSTIYPCIPKHLDKYERDEVINNSCNVQYR